MEPIAASVTELELADGARVFIAPTGAKDVVTIQGSVLGGWNMLPIGKGDVHTLAVDLLDAGTKTKTKDQLRELLSGKGIDLAFSVGGDRTLFYGSCLPEDLGTLLDILVECLSASTFPPKELALAKQRLLGSWEEAKTDTKTQASIASLRAIFEPTHKNYAPTIEERITQTKAVTRAELLAFSKQYGRTGMVLAIVGDVTPSKAGRLARTAIEKLPIGAAKIPEKKLNTKKSEARDVLIPIKDKANIDVYFGASVPITMDDPRYIAFTLFSDMLGGRGLSSGHLMRTIREREGLTYGIYAQLFGFQRDLDGAFRIWGTFSPATFKTAVEKTKKEVKVFASSKLTPDNLLKKQDQIAGSYIVGLSTTQGLAGILHTIGVDGKPLSYLDEYVDLVRAVTVDDLKAIAKLIPLDRLAIAASGSFDK